MTTKPDDLQAVRTLVTTLSGFDATEQERIIRWAREKLGLAANIEQPSTASHDKHAGAEKQLERFDKQVTESKDIKTFIVEKNPTSDNQFAATVAYYYRFEAPPAERKEAITKEDLQEACRKAGRERLKNPGQNLVNAHGVGLLDKAEPGAYKINTVGENLVAMTLPGGSQVKSKKKNNTPKVTAAKGSKSGRKTKSAKG
jgi:hypothetical protein